MGSGHFLVEAVDYLTDELIQILNLYPEDNPVLTIWKPPDKILSTISDNRELFSILPPLNQRNYYREW